MVPSDVSISIYGALPGVINPGGSSMSPSKYAHLLTRPEAAFQGPPKREQKARGSCCNSFSTNQHPSACLRALRAGKDGDKTPDKGQIWDGGVQVLPVPLHTRRRGARLPGAPCLLAPARTQAAEARPSKRPWRPHVFRWHPHAFRVWRFPLLTRARWRCSCPFLPLNHKPQKRETRRNRRT
jgi:hypothetical protein